MITARNILALSAIFFSTAAGQGVLSNGLSTFPSCASSCSALTSIASTCGGTTSADQAVWECFCAAAYKAGAATSTTICASVCPDASDDAQINTWFTANCGSDNGASEHADGNSGGGTATTTTATSSAPSSSTAPTTGSGTTSTSIGGGGSWWDTHYQWIIMVIVLIFGLIALAFLLRFLRNRHRRKRDQINTGFNSGITTRAAPSGPAAYPTAAGHVNDSFVSGAPSGPAESTADASVRTRDAFMPYGYGYTRSESRLGYQADRGSTIGDIEKQGGSQIGENRVQSPDPVNGRSRSGRRIIKRDRNSRNHDSMVYSEKAPQEDDE